MKKILLGFAYFLTFAIICSPFFFSKKSLNQKVSFFSLEEETFFTEEKIIAIVEEKVKEKQLKEIQEKVKKRIAKLKEEVKREKEQKFQEELKKEEKMTLTYNSDLNPLKKDFKPDDLVKFSKYGIKTCKESSKEEITASEKIMKDLSELVSICEKETGLNIYIRSGFRSYGTQTATFSKYGANLSALPGSSEHQLGLAVDIATSYTKGNFLGESNKAFKCFKKEAYKFGFVQSYTRENPFGYEKEPWHWRFVGKANAAFLAENGKLEEPWFVLEGYREDFLKKKLAKN